MTDKSSVYDHIVVGSGAAGAVLAARLSEDKDVRVLLVEAGPRPRDPRRAVPFALPHAPPNPRRTWSYEGEPEPHADGRRLQHRRGRALGGSWSADDLLEAQGHPRDYDEWRQLGARGWGWDDVRRYFDWSEEIRAVGTADQGGGSPGGGERQLLDPHLYPRLTAAAEALGYPIRDTPNVDEQEGFGPPALTIQNGRRVSRSVRHLTPALRRPNLTIATGALVHYVEVAAGRATGIVLDHGRGPERAHAEREIILCAGAYHSPQILLRSGIGPADEIAAHGIAVVQDIPGVGRNLQEHATVLLSWVSRPEYAPNDDLRLDRVALSLVEWLRTGSGRLASPPITAGAFLRTRSDVDRPDAHCLFRPAGPLTRVWAPGWRRPADPVLTVSATLLRPESRGLVRLASADPAASPRILSNLLAAEEDRAFFRRIIPQLRDLMSTEPIASALVRQIEPDERLRSDNVLDAWVRAHIGVTQHPAGTCAMGSGDEAVVDPELRVHGIEGLRVADASVMPRIVGAGGEAVTAMIGERAAELIRVRAAA